MNDLDQNLTNHYAATMVIVHGMSEYSGRYAEFVSFLAKHNIRAICFDLLGHGKEAKATNTLGYFGAKDGDRLVIHQVKEVLNKASSSCSEPLFLFGHSMGSLIVRALLQDNDLPHLDGVILSGTSGPNPLGAIGRTLAQVSKLWFGANHPAKVLDRVMHIGFNKKCGADCHPFAWLSSDSAEVQKYAEDELCGFPFSAAATLDLANLLTRATGAGWATSITQKDLAFLLVSGADDPVGAWGKGVKQVTLELNGAGHFAELELYPNGRHELLKETCRNDVMTKITKWTLQRCSNCTGCNDV